MLLRYELASCLFGHTRNVQWPRANDNDASLYQKKAGRECTALRSGSFSFCHDRNFGCIQSKKEITVNENATYWSDTVTNRIGVCGCFVLGVLFLQSLL